MEYVLIYICICIDEGWKMETTAESPFQKTARAWGARSQLQRSLGGRHLNSEASLVWGSKSAHRV